MRDDPDDLTVAVLPTLSLPQKVGVAKEEVPAEGEPAALLVSEVKAECERVGPRVPWDEAVL